jgi:hypothetical protein
LSDHISYSGNEARASSGHLGMDNRGSAKPMVGFPSEKIKMKFF